MRTVYFLGGKWKVNRPGLIYSRFIMLYNKTNDKPIHVQKSVDWTVVLRNFGTCLKKSRMYEYIPCRCRNIKAEFAISMPFSFLFIFSFIFFLTWLKLLLSGVVQDRLDGCAAHCWPQNDLHSASLSLGTWWSMSAHYNAKWWKTCIESENEMKICFAYMSWQMWFCSEIFNDSNYPVQHRIRACHVKCPS